MVQVITRFIRVRAGLRMRTCSGYRWWLAGDTTLLRIVRHVPVGGGNRRLGIVTSITFENTTRIYENSAHPAVKELNLQVGDGEFLVLVGPSGCGKSTTLRMLAGLEPVNSGRIFLGRTEVTDLDPKERDVAMVFQNYALYPHMSVGDNMGFSLKCAGVPKSEIQERVSQIAHLLGIQDLLERRPKALSGGQRQRVAMGRAIVRNPQAFLMDEPLSNLDAQLRLQMRSQIAKLQHQLGTTTLYVTHDQTEALTMGNRIAVLHQGVLQQVGSPRELYQLPANRFVAEFIGSPAMNLLHFAVRFDACAGLLKLGGASALLPPKLAEVVGRSAVTGTEVRLSAIGQSDATTGGTPRVESTLAGAGKVAPTVVVGVRPEHFRIIPGWRIGGWTTGDWRTGIGEAAGASTGISTDNFAHDGQFVSSVSGNSEDFVGVSPGEVAIPLLVDLVEELGADSYVHGRIAGSGQSTGTLTHDCCESGGTSQQVGEMPAVTSNSQTSESTGMAVVVRVRPDHGLKPGDKITATVSIDKVHLFAADETGSRLA